MAAQSAFPMCGICDKPVSLETRKADEKGVAVHEACYVLTIIRAGETCGLPNSATFLQHLTDARSLYAGGKYHSSLNESRKLIETLIDGISTETNLHGNHSTKLASGAINQIEYLKNVNFSTFSEQSEFLSVWCSLCGSHHGVSEREQARLGLALALEFGQLLLLKFSDWKANGYRGFN